MLAWHAPWWLRFRLLHSLRCLCCHACTSTRRSDGSLRQRPVGVPSGERSEPQSALGGWHSMPILERRRDETKCNRPIRSAQQARRGDSGRYGNGSYAPSCRSLVGRNRRRRKRRHFQAWLRGGDHTGHQKWQPRRYIWMVSVPTGSRVRCLRRARRRHHGDPARRPCSARIGSGRRHTKRAERRKRSLPQERADSTGWWGQTSSCPRRWWIGGWMWRRCWMRRRCGCESGAA